MVRYDWRIFHCFVAVLLLAIISAQHVRAQQVADDDYSYTITSPAYELDTGPTMAIDSAHGPYIAGGAYDPFLRLLRSDGFQADYLDSKISTEILAGVEVLVIVNSFREDFEKFSVLEPPSAYEDAEILAIRNWVNDGGRLLLIGDHSPFAGGISKLAEAFGFTFVNGFVLEKSALPFRNGDIKYHVSNGLNAKNPVLSGGFSDQPIERFMVFLGSAFIAPPKAISLLTIPQGFVALMMKLNQRNIDDVFRLDVSGLSQGATLEVGKGRVAVFAEASSFSAQLVRGIEKYGMNNVNADQNAPFVLATIRWLAEGL